MEESNWPHYGYHRCQRQAYLGTYSSVEIVYNGDGSPNWSFHMFKTATERDLLENCLYENVGDLIESKAIEIEYCPYCGKNLAEESNMKLSNGTTQAAPPLLPKRI